jgi:hypothetical protein
MMAVIGFGVMVPVAGLLADAFGRRKSMIVITTLIILFALFALNRCWAPAAGAGLRLPAAGPEPDGADLRPDGRAAAGAVPDGSSLPAHRSRITSRRFSAPPSRRILPPGYRELWSDGGRPLSGGHGRADADCAAVDPRNAPSVAVVPAARRDAPGTLLTLYFFICAKSPDTDSHPLALAIPAPAALPPA